MKKIRNIDHLVAEKNLLELRKLQLEKEMNRQLHDIKSSVRQPAAAFPPVVPFLQRLVSSFAVKKLTNGIGRWLKN